MTLVADCALAMFVLGAAGALPVVALVGFRWYAIALCPLLGALFADVAVTGVVGIGGTTMAWFVAVSALGFLASLAWLWVRPARRPWAAPGPLEVPESRELPENGAIPGSRSDREIGTVRGSWVIGLLGFVAVGGACAWCLEALATPSIGFDARSIWLMRAGWFLQPHHQVMLDLSWNGIGLPQTSYPPLVSAASAVAWYVTGNHSMRFGVVVITLLNTCALVTAALAVVESGRRVTTRLSIATGKSEPAAGSAMLTARGRAMALMPSLAGVVVAVALVFITFGVAEPFMTDGYADPIWSICALGAVAYGLQMPGDRSCIWTAAILVLVAGTSKEEGVATAVLLILLLVARQLVSTIATRRSRWWRPLVAGMAGLASVGAWPGFVRLRHLRSPTVGGSSPVSAYASRAHQAIDGLAPFLHVVLLAVPVAAVGGLFLSRLRRATGIANDGWAWAGLLAGSVVILAAFITGTTSVPFWLIGSGSRVSEFTALSAWWIISLWAVSASAAPAYRRGGTGPLPGRKRQASHA